MRRRTFIKSAGAAVCSTLCGAGFAAAEADDAPARFDALADAPWQEAFFDCGDGDWKQKWFLDGEVGTVANTPAGMQLTAGPRFEDDAHHMVLWTKASFEGSMKIEYDYTRLDSETRCVNILYIQATGNGDGPYKKDISAWKELRRVPAMKLYFLHMNTYHISYAAYDLGKDVAMDKDYVRARRYMPRVSGLKGTELLPDYSQTGLFRPGVPHRITVIKRGNLLAMRGSNDKQSRYFFWRTDHVPAIEEGRIGLRQMYTRSARYMNFRVSRCENGTVPLDAHKKE